MDKNKQIVCVGGGTGLSTMLRGLKKHTEELTAIVTMADNGGSSGVLRKEMKMLPPGDVRNCLLALAETEPIMQDIFQFRFDSGQLKGQNLGNLFLAALTSMYGNFELAIEKANDVLAVKGQVIPVTVEDVQLQAMYEDGTRVLGEHEIVYTNKFKRKRITNIELVPGEARANPRAIEAILKADIVVLGPGSLHTSIVPNLLVEGVAKAIAESMGMVVYVGNIMTQPGETDGYTLQDHLDVIERYLGKDVIKYVIANRTELPPDIDEHYKSDGARLVENDTVQQDNRQVIETDFAIIASEHQYVRHDAEILAEIIMDLEL